MKKNIYIIIAFLLYTVSLYPKALFIEASALVYNGALSNDGKPLPSVAGYQDVCPPVATILSKSSVDIVYDFIYGGSSVYVYNYSKDDKDVIKNKISNVKFLNSFLIFFYKRFYFGGVFYASSREEIYYLEKAKKEYIQVVFDTNDVDKNNLLELKNNYGKNILIGYEIRENIKIEVDREKIIVIDGDTIDIDNRRFRLLAIDAPEIKQEYGATSLKYLKTLVSNAKKVSISPASFDNYNRVLAHLFVDDVPVAYNMIKNKFAFQTITYFSDNGFPTISSNVIELARKQGKMPFLNPSTYRERVRNGQTNNLTVKKPVSKKKIVKQPKKTTQKKVKAVKLSDTKINDNIGYVVEEIINIEEDRVTALKEGGELIEYDEGVSSIESVDDIETLEYIHGGN